MTDELETTDSLNGEENLDSNPETPDEDLTAKLSKAEEIAKNQKIRAEKAEQELRALKKTPMAEKPKEKETPKNEPEMSLKDIRALQDVHDDDVDEVIDFAKYKGVTIAEAKKSTVIQTLLRTKEEERKTAEATNVSGARRGSSKVTGEELLNRAAKEDLTDEEMVLAARARIARLKAQND